MSGTFLPTLQNSSACGEYCKWKCKLYYIEQKSISSRDKHAYRLYVNGTVVKEVINNEARAFQNVLVYGSDPWHEAADVTIRDFQFGSL